MSRLLEVIRIAITSSTRNAPSKSSRPGGHKLNSKRKTKKYKAPHQVHFYDPNGTDEMASSSDDLTSVDLDRRQKETFTRIDDAEAALAKERKRIEHLNMRRKEAETREEQRRIQLDEYADLSPRERNRLEYERAVSRVERNALRKIEELERKFAYSDKVYELSMARQELETAEQPEGVAVGEEHEGQHESGT